MGVDTCLLLLVRLSDWLRPHLSVHLSVCLSTYVDVDPAPAHLSFPQSVHVSDNLSLCLSDCLCFRLADSKFPPVSRTRSSSSQRAFVSLSNAMLHKVMSPAFRLFPSTHAAHPLFPPPPPLLLAHLSGASPGVTAALGMLPTCLPADVASASQDLHLRT